MKLRWLARAQRHLIEIHAYIAADNKKAARKVVQRIQAAAPLLARHSQAGRAGRVEGTREFAIPDTPYLIVYRIHGQEAQILAIQHGAQQWPEDI
jgi:addiction module RelE/StbE family toxin